MAGREVFISYGRDEATNSFVDDLETKIENNTRFRAFVDRSDMPASTEWEKRIDKVIEDCFAMIVVITEKSADSKWVTYEWATAIAKGKSVYPLARDTSAKNILHGKLKTINYVQPDPFQSPTEKDWKNLLNQLEQEYERIHKPKQVETAQEAAEHYDPKQSQAAIDALEKYEHQGAIVALKELVLESYLPDVRINASFALARRTLKDFGSPSEDAINGLIKKVDSYSGGGEARELLRAMNSDAAAKAMTDEYIRISTESTNQPNEQIIRALDGMTTPDVLPHLRRIWLNESTKNKSLLRQALMKRADEAIKSYLMDEARKYGNEGWNYDNKQDLLRHIMHYDIYFATDWIIELLQTHHSGRYNRDDNLLKEALELLSKYGEEYTIEHLQNLIDENNVPRWNKYMRQIINDMKRRIGT